MNPRMRMTTGVLAVAFPLLAACGSEEPATEPTPSPSAPSSASTPEPSEAPADAAPQTAEDLVGTWESKEAEWIVRFGDDGRFTEDFEGVKDFRTGTYRLEDGVVSLVGDDGNTDDGKVEGSRLTFQLGTLQRA